MMLTLAEVTDRLRVTERFVRSEIYAGRLKAMKAGVGRNSPFRISEDDLAAYIEARTVKPTAEAAS